ncbi:hypothetical protein PHAVU_002G307900 [Phaseolus vulgaris]|uniref:Oxidative stress 3 n=1 Tax=Phaseolus vulgaris TaxID=3885 RepID=V7CPZ6_PHAVU|nr:hypothetical protein PHAVU_002G307900g [Phaseolus vulgaris]ESW32272.1 hypothetical protein PHAVU_002G307900g [Phaseolus vulgaris]
MNVKGIMDGNKLGAANNNWVVKEDLNDDMSDSISIGSISGDSVNSVCSFSSSELAEDASSSSTSYLSTSSSSSHSNGPLFELSELMNQLPLKRGLSMFYEGKAQSFSSLASVESLEDLVKKERPYRKKMKSCNSFGGGLDTPRISFTPKATISKKASRGGTLVSVLTKRRSFLGGSRNSFAVQKNF